MVMLYVGGKTLGTWAEPEKLIDELLQSKQEIELRDEKGKLLSRMVPAAEPIGPWEPELTHEDIQRRIAEGGITLAEFWKKMV